MTRRKIPMTPDGLRRLHEELKNLKTVERPKIVAEIEAARAHGDISENAEFHAAKEKQAHIAMRISEVENTIVLAQVIDPKSVDHKKVVFGATVRLSDLNGGGDVRYQIVGADESDVKLRKISIESPIAKSLIGKSVGDRVTVTTPRGTKEFEILEIKFE